MAVDGGQRGERLRVADPRLDVIRPWKRRYSVAEIEALAYDQLEIRPAGPLAELHPKALEALHWSQSSSGQTPVFAAERATSRGSSEHSPESGYGELYSAWLLS